MGSKGGGGMKPGSKGGMPPSSGKGAASGGKPPAAAKAAASTAAASAATAPARVAAAATATATATAAAKVAAAPGSAPPASIAPTAAAAGSKRKRAPATAAEAAAAPAPASGHALRHDLAGTRLVCLALPAAVRSDDGAAPAYLDVFMKAASSATTSAAGTEALAGQVVAYTQGRELSAAGWTAVWAAHELAGVRVAGSGRAAGEDGDPGLYWALLDFGSPAAARRALGAECEYPVTDGDGNLLGLRGWLAAHQSGAVPPRALQAAVDAYVAAFDAAEEVAAAAKAEAARRMDADGFTLVKRSSAKGGAAAVVAAGGAGGAGGDDEDVGLGVAYTESDAQRAKRKKGGLIKEDFYAFQKTESRLDRLHELRRQFEEDKERIRKVKEARQFKPF